MKIVYYVPMISLCGGVRVILEHNAGLLSRGNDCEVYCLGGNASWFKKPTRIRVFPNADELGKALKSFSGVKVATWWQTAFAIQTCRVDGDKWFYLVQDIDQRTYGGDNSGSSYKLGLQHITEAEYVQCDLKNSYGLDSVNVGIGIDPDVFNPLPFIRERYRVLTPYRTHSAGPMGLKGWDRAVQTLRKLVQLEPRASCVTFGMERSPGLDFIPHIHIQNPTDAKLRELYSQSGVFLSCSRHEGFGLPMLEAMACALPVVCTDSHGNREFCKINHTALIGDDPDQLAELIADVMTKPDLADRLSSRGREKSEEYRWGTVIDKLEKLYTV